MKESGNTNIFYCEFKGCLYTEGSERYFTCKKNLKQHIEKVHAEKKYLCTKCRKGFSNDWFRRRHEKSCESKWQCSCGLKYQYRESLLTHFRRSQHALPEEILPKKKPLPKSEKKENQSHKPLVIIVQPSMAYIPLLKTNGTRFILPKQPQLPQTTPNCSHSPGKEYNKECSNFSMECPVVIDDVTSRTSSDICHKSNQYMENCCVAPSKQNTGQRMVAETQTCYSLSSNQSFQQKSCVKNLESRGSQCSGVVTKHKVKIQSSCTQTVESTVVKMKKKTSRSRRKSVAVITDLENGQPTQSLWSDFENYLLSKDSESQHKSDKYSAATQTNAEYNTSNKILCDSQTLTDTDFLQLSWPLNKEQEYMDNTDSSFQVISELTTDSALAQSQIDECESELFPLKNPVQAELISDDNNTLEWLMKNSEPQQNETSTATESLRLTENNSSNNALLTSIFGGCFPIISEPLKVKDVHLNEHMVNNNSEFASDIHNNGLTQSENMVLNPTLNFSQESISKDSEARLLSHSHTQTCLDNMDYSNIFTHMETQTTDDFLLSDLEFLDMETQTPWNDLHNDTLSVDQLSIESQTDFTTLVTESVADFSLMSASSVGNLQNYVNKAVGKHMETQTNDLLELPQLTDSEAQTLLASEYLFI